MFVHTCVYSHEYASAVAGARLYLLLVRGARRSKALTLSPRLAADNICIIYKLHLFNVKENKCIVRL